MDGVISLNFLIEIFFILRNNFILRYIVQFSSRRLRYRVRKKAKSKKAES